MSEQAIAQAEIDAVFPKVAQIVADALGCELDEVTPQASLIEDLDAESIDFLDLVFRLEKGFGVKIPRGKIVEDARGPLPESEFESKGIVTEAGLTRLTPEPLVVSSSKSPCTWCDYSFICCHETGVHERALEAPAKPFEPEEEPEEEEEQP